MISHDSHSANEQQFRNGHFSIPLFPNHVGENGPGFGRSHETLNFGMFSTIIYTVEVNLHNSYAVSRFADRLIDILKIYSLLKELTVNPGSLLADVIECTLYLCKSNLMFVPYFSLFNIHSHTPERDQ